MAACISGVWKNQPSPPKKMEHVHPCTVIQWNYQTTIKYTMLSICPLQLIFKYHLEIFPPILNHPLPLGFPVAGVVERKLIRNEMLSLSRTQNH